jgi:hypothetical protein
MMSPCAYFTVSICPTEMHTSAVMSGSCHGVNEIFTLLECNAAWNNSSSSSSGPGAYSPDVLQPIGLLCDPEPPPPVV